MQLFDVQGQRLYLTESERAAFLKASAKAESSIHSFCLVLAYTGCRISEALALTPKRIDSSGKSIIFESLKKRKSGIYRVVPVPDFVLEVLERVHHIEKALSTQNKDQHLWPWCRMTAYRKVMEVMDTANISDGPYKCPKGLRHGFGIMAISKGVPLNMLSKWMGHASLEVTSIYTNALGEEQRNIASRMWEPQKVSYRGREQLRL